MSEPLDVYDLERINRVLNNPTRFEKRALLDAAKQLRAEVERQREVIADFNCDNWTPESEG